MRDALSDRVQRENLENVAVKLGTPDDPMLPAHSFDRIFLVHMYHEVQSPYAFLWHLRDGLKPGGLVIVVDSNRPVKRHGTPPAQLRCEFAALGMAPVKFQMLSSGEVYFARSGGRPKPAPEQIVPCKGRRSAGVAPTLRRPEARAAPSAQAGALRPGEHQMVEHGAVERFGGGRQPPRCSGSRNRLDADCRSGGCARARCRRCRARPRRR